MGVYLPLQPQTYPAMKKMLLFLLSGLLATALSAQTTRIPPAAAGNIPYRAGQWLPSDQKVLSQWLSDKILLAEKSADGFHPVVEEFRQLIENDPVVFMLFHQMFSQVPRKPPYNNDPMGKPQIRDYMHMLQVINHVLTTAPEFNKTGLVGFPINAILDWPMGTPAGFAAFTNDKVNLHLKRILNAWGDFLKSPESRYVLNTDPHSDGLVRMPWRPCRDLNRCLSAILQHLFTVSLAGTIFSQGGSGRGNGQWHRPVMTM